jgi:small GTP-binding protein
MRCVFLGDSGIGKTTFLKKAVHDNSPTAPTIGVDSIVYMSNENKLHCWDTAGTQRFERIAIMFATSVDAIIYMYDVSTPATLERVRYWRKLTEKNESQPEVHILVGLKQDLQNKCSLDGYEDFIPVMCPTEQQTMDAIIDIIQFHQPQTAPTTRQTCCF